MLRSDLPETFLVSAAAAEYLDSLVQLAAAGPFAAGRSLAGGHAAEEGAAGVAGDRSPPVVLASRNINRLHQTQYENRRKFIFTYWIFNGRLIGRFIVAHQADEALAVQCGAVWHAGRVLHHGALQSREHPCNSDMNINNAVAWFNDALNRIAEILISFMSGLY